MTARTTARTTERTTPPPDRRKDAPMTDPTQTPDPAASPRRLTRRERLALVRAAHNARRADLTALAAHPWPSVREVAEDETRRRSARRAGMTFRRVADGPTRRLVAAPPRPTRVSRYRVSGRPADLHGYTLA